MYLVLAMITDYIRQDDNVKLFTISFSLFCATPSTFVTATTISIGGLVW
jgi:hypothetical protein